MIRGRGEREGEPLFLAFHREQDGMVSVHVFAGDDHLLELVGHESDVRLALDEPIDWSQ